MKHFKTILTAYHALTSKRLALIHNGQYGVIEYDHDPIGPSNCWASFMDHDGNGDHVGWNIGFDASNLAKIKKNLIVQEIGWRIAFMNEDGKWKSHAKDYWGVK